MNKIFKKLCGTLCIGIIVLGMGSVNAATDGGSMSVSTKKIKASIDNKGDFASDLTFNITKDTITSTTCDYKSKGDLNKDGVADSQDSLIILKYVNNPNIDLDGITDTDANKATFLINADINCDKNITDKDALIILKIAAKMNVDGEFSDEQHYETTVTPLSTDEIEYLKYSVIAGDSALYNAIKAYMTFNIDENLTTEQIEAYEVIENNYQKALDSLKLETSSNNSTIKGNIGETKVNTIYLYVDVKAKDGNYTNAVVELDTSNFDWTTYLNSLKEDTNKDQNGNTNEDGTTKEPVKTDETKNEETVKNPETAVTISIIGGILVLGICALASKKKNLFNKI